MKEHPACTPAVPIATPLIFVETLETGLDPPQTAKFVTFTEVIIFPAGTGLKNVLLKQDAEDPHPPVLLIQI